MGISQLFFRIKLSPSLNICPHDHDTVYFYSFLVSLVKKIATFLLFSAFCYEIETKTNDHAFNYILLYSLAV